MELKQLERKFEEMGARVKIEETRSRTTSGMPRLNILKDKKGEYFQIAFPADVDPATVEILDVQPKDRHLLFMAKEQSQRSGVELKSKFLCGHDERHWFVAAIPEAARGVGTVTTAKQALQPKVVQDLLAKSGLKPIKALKRKNEIYCRQGEWFFIPAPKLTVDDDLILRNEPLTRGRGSKSHTLELAYRRGGTIVHVHREYAIAGMIEKEYNKLSDDKKKALGWRVMTRDPELYCKGRVTHADHATINLSGWCRVVMNTEAQAAAMRHVAFLD